MSSLEPMDAPRFGDYVIPDNYPDNTCPKQTKFLAVDITGFGYIVGWYDLNKKYHEQSFNLQDLRKA